MISEDVKAQMREICARYPTLRSGMLPCLHLAQAIEGYITSEGIAAVAEATGTRPDEVDSVVSFYSMYHREPQSQHVIKVCTSISCYLMGCDDILAHLENRLGIRQGESTPDRQFTLKGVECLAACGMAPALQVDEDFVENVTPQVADTMLERLRHGESVSGMTANWDVAGIGTSESQKDFAGKPQPASREEKAW
ncbi:MAG: NADH-quinone oxidoreductase subunit NuoE [Ktedonobacterales bacterium]